MEGQKKRVLSGAERQAKYAKENKEKVALNEAKKNFQRSKLHRIKMYQNIEIYANYLFYVFAPYKRMIISAWPRPKLITKFTFNTTTHHPHKLLRYFQTS
jgi:hypothetical protein